MSCVQWCFLFAKDFFCIITIKIACVSFLQCVAFRYQRGFALRILDLFGLSLRPTANYIIVLIKGSFSSLTVFLFFHAFLWFGRSTIKESKLPCHDSLLALFWCEYQISVKRKHFFGLFGVDFLIEGLALWVQSLFIALSHFAIVWMPTFITHCKKKKYAYGQQFQL